MALDTKYVTSLVELARRRHAPQGADLQRGLHLARLFETDPSIPIAYRSLAWHVITESHEAAGWPMPDGERFPACCGAAASTKHGCALLIQDVSEQINAVNGRVLLLGALAASRSVFGNWSVLPTAGSYLIPLDDLGDTRPPTAVYRDAVGVRWGTAGDLRDVFETHSYKVQLGGREVHIPSPTMIAARTAGCSNQPEGLGCLIFVAAAHAVVNAGDWADTLKISPRLGPQNNPLSTARSLGIDTWLGLRVPAPRRAIRLLKRLLSSSRAA
jgi:hypothetical protein